MSNGQERDKICQSGTNYKLTISTKILGASQFIMNCAGCVRISVRNCQVSCSRSLREDIRKCQDLKFCTIRVVIRDSGTALFGQPEIHRISNTTLTRIKGINIRGPKKMFRYLKPHA